MDREQVIRASQYMMLLMTLGLIITTGIMSFDPRHKSSDTPTTCLWFSAFIMLFLTQALILYRSHRPEPTQSADQCFINERPLTTLFLTASAITLMIGTYVSGSDSQHTNYHQLS